MSEDKANNCYRGRIAPTPSGFLHLGHIRTFRKAWERAKQARGQLVLRMDNLDFARCNSRFFDACIEDIEGMGIRWDEGPDIGGDFGPYTQKMRSDIYLSVLRKLLESNLIYPCVKSRKEISSAGLMNSNGEEYLYPQHFRPLNNQWKKNEFPGAVNWRFATQWEKEVSFIDQKMGKVDFKVGQEFSDFLVWRKDGFASYELASVVDDKLMKITEVVRGEDLLISSARQCLLFDALGWNRPDFFHCGLVLGADGKKLSKSTRTLPRLFSTP